MKVKLTRERVILGGFMLAAALGLLVDRFVLAAPPVDGTADENNPSLPAPAVVANRGSPAAPHVVAKPRTPEALLAARLAALAGPMPTDLDAVRDVFAAVAAPVAAERPLEPASTAPTADNVQQRSRWQTRTLGGVILRSDGRKIAIVDGRLVPLGSSYDGLRLVQLTQEAAVFTDGRLQLTLRPPRGANGD